MLISISEQFLENTTSNTYQNSLKAWYWGMNMHFQVQEAVAWMPDCDKVSDETVMCELGVHTCSYKTFGNQEIEQVMEGEGPDSRRALPTVTYCIIELQSPRIPK